jgi:methionyl-tRNA formyltransferase
MKIILMGQQAFGKSTLEKFHKETDHEVVAVYCAPDKEGKPLDPVKEYAVSESLPVFQPSNFKDKEVLEQIKSHNADLCVMAYVIIFVPEEARDIPKHGSICFHPSLLPLHRGPSSIDACVEAANLLDAGNAPKTPQDDSKSTYESWCRKADARIDWKKPGIEVYNLIRGCNPQPGAWAEFMDEEFVFLDTKFSSEQSAEHFPGQIMEINAEDVKIAVKGGFLIVSRFKSKEQGKLYVKDMNTAVLTEGDLFS